MYWQGPRGLKEVRPDDHAAMGGEALVGEADPYGRRTIGGGNLHPHHLARPLSRCLFLVFCIKPSPPDGAFPFQLHRSG